MFWRYVRHEMKCHMRISKGEVWKSILTQVTSYNGGGRKGFRLLSAKRENGLRL